MLYQTQNPHGGDIYDGKTVLDFSANTNPFGTPQGVLEAMRDALSQVHHYPDPCCRELVQAISVFEGVPKQHILCGNGAAELIYAYCDACRPKSAMELAPTFSEYALGLERVGCRVERYVLRQEENFDLREAFLDVLARQKPEVVFLCNPNNPTGKLIPPNLLESILECCDRNGIRLFLDECFLDLSDGDAGMKRFVNDHPRLLILKAFTKSYGMAGVRLGYCLCSDHELLSQMSKAVQPWNVSLLAQAAGTAALREVRFLQKTRALVSTERAWLKEELESLGFWVCPSNANFLLFFGETGLCAALKERGIALRNCDNYLGLGPGWYRIAVRQHSENEALIGAMKTL